MRYVVSVDWLSLYCKGSILADSGFFDFVREQGGTAQFAERWTVYDRVTREGFADIQMRPYSKIIPSDAVIVKIKNKVLYREGWWHDVLHFLNVTGLIPESISRIDICADFNYLDRGLHPKTLIDRFLRNEYLKMGTTKYDIIGEQKGCQDFSYIRFGNRENEVCVYMYNKTKELQEVKNKPYIVALWKENGLDINKDVWRLEVSMRTDKLRIIEKETGEVIRLGLPYLKTVGIIENIYMAAIKRFFNFKINDGQQKKSRMKDVEIFASRHPTILLREIPKKVTSNRTDKIVVKKIANYFSEYHADTAKERLLYEDVLRDILDKTDLWDYYNAVVTPNIGFYIKR